MKTLIYRSCDGFYETLEPHAGTIVDVVLDSRDISTHVVSLPDLTDRKAKQTIAFALEGQVLGDIEALHFFPAKQGDTGKWAVIVCDRSILEDIVELLDSAKVKLNCIYPSFMTLPVPERGPVYCTLEDGVLYRSGEQTGGWLPETSFQALFPSAEPRVQSKPQKAVNLAAPFSQAFVDQWLRPWFVPIGLAMLLVVIHTIQLGWTHHELSVQLTNMKTQNKVAFRELFPSTKRIVDLPFQAKQNFEAWQSAQADPSRGFISAISSLEQPANAPPLARLKFEDGKLTRSQK